MSPRSSSVGGSPRTGSSRSSGGHHGDHRARYDRRFVGRLGQRLERGHVSRRAGGAEQLGAESLGRRRDQLDRQPVDGDADRPAVVALDHADDLRQVGEAVEESSGLGARRTRPRGARTSRATAARRPPSSPSERGRDVADELARAIEQQSLARARLIRRRPAPRAAAPRSSARSRARSAAARPPPPRGTRRPCERRAPARARSSAWRPVRGSAPGRPGPAPARARARPARRSRRSRRARAAAPRSPARSRAARAPGRCRTRSATGSAAPRIVSAAAAVRPRGVRVGLGQLEQRRERVEAVGDVAVVHPP